jgi:hypothetical protein
LPRETFEGVKPALDLISVKGSIDYRDVDSNPRMSEPKFVDDNGSRRMLGVA